VLAAWTLDWGTTLLLAGIVVLEGVRRTSTGAFIIREVPGDGWSVVHGPTERAEWRLASWGAPLLTHIVLGHRPELSTSESALSHGTALPSAAIVRDRRRRLRRWTIALRTLGGMDFLTLVLGVPVLTAQYGRTGLYVGLAGIFGLSTLGWGLGALALRALGTPLRLALRRTRGLLSPFVTPRAAEIILERALDDIPPLVVVLALLPSHRFAAWIRPHVYDSLAGTNGPCRREIEAVIDRRECEAIMATPPPTLAAREGYCPRCGEIYRDERLVCPDCETVALVRTSPQPPG
jgi:hypothetical protein